MNFTIVRVCPRVMACKLLGKNHILRWVIEMEFT